MLTFFVLEPEVNGFVYIGSSRNDAEAKRNKIAKEL